MHWRTVSLCAHKYILVPYFFVHPNFCDLLQRDNTQKRMIKEAYLKQKIFQSFQKKKESRKNCLQMIRNFQSYEWPKNVRKASFTTPWKIPMSFEVLSVLFTECDWVWTTVLNVSITHSIYVSLLQRINSKSKGKSFKSTESEMQEETKQI